MERQIEPIENEINLLDLLIVLVKRKGLIIGITLGIALITAIVSFTMTPIYKAETKILPPQQGSSSMTSQLLSQLGGAASFIGGTVGVKSSNDLYIAILKSRPILDNIIDKFKLMELHKAKSREDTRKALIGVLKMQDDKKSGIVSVGIEGKDPKMAADIANAFVDELREYNKRLALTEASQRRLFFEEQLKDVKEGLIKSEEGMKGFQEKTGAFKIDDQAKAAIEGIVQLRALIAEKEIQIRVMKTYATSHNPDIQKLEEELKGLREHLSILEAKGSGGNPDVILSTGRIPALGTEYIRKMREFKYNEALYEIMAKQYEMARLDEAKDAPIIQVIEKAIPPEKRIKPNRSQMVMIATVAGFFFSVFAAFLMEFIEKSSADPKTREGIKRLRILSGLKGSIRYE
ncbi:MAG: Wzz/FepE/Etk N-terminal domain-containing protein [Deltaproteobacteria bacterium]